MIKKYSLNQSFQIVPSVHKVLISSYDPNVSDDLIQKIIQLKQIEVHEKLHIQQLKDWDFFLQRTQNYSLFPEKKLLEITIDKNALPTKDFPRIIPLEDELYILKTSIFKHAFLNHIEQNKDCIWLGIYSPSRQELWQWLSQQLSAKKFTIHPDCATWFVQLQHIDFGLCQQMVNKIELQFPEPVEINSAILNKQLGFYNEDDWQPLIDSWIQKDLHKTTQLLKIARETQQELTLLLWLLNRTLQVWYALLQNKQSRQNIFQQFKVWPNQIPLFEKSLKNQNLKNIETMMLLLQEADEYYKTYQQNQTWIKLEKLFYTQYVNHEMCL